MWEEATLESGLAGLSHSNAAYVSCLLAGNNFSSLQKRVCFILVKVESFLGDKLFSRDT